MKIKKIAVILIGIITICSGVIFAETLSIHKAIQSGLKNSYSMIQQNYELEQSKNNLYSSFLNILPTAQYGISSTTSDGTTNKSGSISLSESISSNDYRYFSIKKDVSSLKQEKLNNEINRKNFIYDVISKYIDVLKAKKYLKISAQKVKQSKMDMSHTQTLFDNGKASTLDVEQAKISLYQVKIDSMQASNNYENSITNLCFFINISDRENYEFEDLDFELADESRRMTIQRDESNPVFIEENNLSIEYSKESLKQAKLSYFEDKLSFLPTMRFSMSKNWNWGEVDKIVNDFNSSNSSSYTLSLSYPLLNPLTNYPSYRSSKLDLKISKLNLKNIKKEKNNDFAYQVKLLQQQMKNLELLKRQEKLTERHFDLTRQKYQLGKVDLSDMESEREKLFTAKFDNIRAYYELILLQEKINMITNQKLLGSY
ncbi:MAG: TolC family protein [Candidatus Cloacimonadota bacterium]|nr:TolC family protein [Candidatus Cloacimonadota bacterium]